MKNDTIHEFLDYGEFLKKPHVVSWQECNDDNQSFVILALYMGFFPCNSSSLHGEERSASHALHDHLYSHLFTYLLPSSQVHNTCSKVKYCKN